MNKTTNFSEVNINTVASGSFRLNRQLFDEDNLKDTNLHRLSLDEKVSRPTLVKYLNEEGVDRFSGSVLYAILVTGFKLTPDEIKNMRIGDVFDVGPVDEVAK